MSITKINLIVFYKSISQSIIMSLIFFVINRIRGNCKGKIRKTLISKKETEFIHRLYTLKLRVLNIVIRLNCFIREVIIKITWRNKKKKRK